jgi:NADH dehydrogenase [ubiquinone] 1 alpha subcomplex assembly factor 3
VDVHNEDRRMRAFGLSRFGGVYIQKAFGSPGAPAAAAWRRSYSIYEDFNVFSGSGTGKVIIDEYDDTGFKANGVRHEGSMIALGKLMFSWSPRSLEEVTPDSLAIFQLLRPAPVILVIGCGKRIDRVSPEVREFMKFNRIKIEAVDTRNAASTFNILNEEGRQVAVAMLPHGWSST